MELAAEGDFIGIGSEGGEEWEVYWWNICVLLVENKGSVSNGKVRSAVYCYLTNKCLSVQCL